MSRSSVPFPNCDVLTELQLDCDRWGKSLSVDILVGQDCLQKVWRNVLQ